MAELIMMCGISGSGKSTISEFMRNYGVHHLNTDEKTALLYFVLYDVVVCRLRK